MSRYSRYPAPLDEVWAGDRWDAERPPARRDGRGLPALIGVLAVAGVALWWLGGPPRVPAARPDIATLRGVPDFLRSSPHLADFRPALPWALAGGWLLWSWLILSVLLQLGVAALEILTRGATWVRALRPLVDVATATLARRVVTGATASYLLIRVLAATSGGAHAAALPDQGQTLVLADPTDPHATGAVLTEQGEVTPGTVDYVIQRGDSLWRIAALFYGDGEQYPRLLSANQGRLQSNGEPFQGLLYPGEVLLVPLAGMADPNAPRVHVVRPGETLRAIAATELGDESRWPTLLVDGVPARQALADPDLIHPGLRVTVPGPTAAPAAVAPLTLPDSAVEARDGQPATIPITVAPDGTPLTVAAVTQGAHGTVTVQPDGMLIYMPTPSYAGVDVFTVTARDEPGRTATATIRVTVTSAVRPGVPAPPTVRGTAIGAVISGRLAVPVPVPAPMPTGGGAVGSAPLAEPPSPATPAPQSSLVPTPAVVRPTGGAGDPVAPALGAGVAGLALVVGGAVLLRRRRSPVAGREVVRRMRRAPQPSWQRDPAGYPTDFERADPTHALRHRLAGGEPDPAVVLAAHTAAFLAHDGLTGSTVLLATHERQRGIVAVRTTLAERPRVLALAAALGARLGGRGSGERQGNDVELRLAAPTARGLLGPLPEPAPLMIALAALPNGATLFANYDVLGHLLIAGAPGDGADVVLTALVAELAARHAPDELRLHALAARRALPGDLLALPHWDGARVDPADAAGVATLLAGLQRELDERRRDAVAPEDASDAVPTRPLIALVLGELDGVDDRGLTTLAQLGQDGPAHGIRLIAATTRPAAVREELLGYFATRAVLRLPDTAQSVRLIGSPDATTLGGGGHLLLRLAGEPPRPVAGVEPGALRGLRIAAEDLVALARDMRDHYGSPPDAATPDAALAHNGSDEVALELAGLCEEPYDAFADGIDASPGDVVTGPTHAVDMLDSTNDPTFAVADAGGAAEAEDTDGMSELPLLVPPGGNEVLACAREESLVLDQSAVAGGAWWTDGVEDAPNACPATSAVAPVAGGSALPVDRPKTLTIKDESHTQRNGHVGRLDGHAPYTTDDDSEAPGDGEPIAVGPSSSIADGEAWVVDGGCAAAPIGVAVPPMPGGVALPEHAGAAMGLIPQRNCAGPDEQGGPGEDADNESDDPLGPLATLGICCFGSQPQLTYGGRRLTLSSPTAVELLALLAVSPPGPVDRERVLDLLWPGDEDEEAKSKRLRTTMWRLNRDLGRQGIDLPRSFLRAERDGTIVLDPAIVRSDVHRFFALCDRATANTKPPPPLGGADGTIAACHEAFGLLTASGPGEKRLLHGTGYEWLDDVSRGVKLEDRLRARLRRAIERVVERCLAERRYEDALTLLRPLFAEDDTDEGIARKLLTVYGELGDRTSVQAVARTLRRALKRTYLDGLTDEERALVTADCYAPERETRLLLARWLAEAPAIEMRSSAGRVVPEPLSLLTAWPADD